MPVDMMLPCREEIPNLSLDVHLIYFTEISLGGWHSGNGHFGSNLGNRQVMFLEMVDKIKQGLVLYTYPKYLDILACTNRIDRSDSAESGI